MREREREYGVELVKKGGGERIGLSRNPESSFLLVVSAMEVSTQRSLF